MPCFCGPQKHKAKASGYCIAGTCMALFCNGHHVVAVQKFECCFMCVRHGLGCRSLPHLPAQPFTHHIL